MIPACTVLLVAAARVRSSVLIFNKVTMKREVIQDCSWLEGEENSNTHYNGWLSYSFAENISPRGYCFRQESQLTRHGLNRHDYRLFFSFHCTDKLTKHSTEQLSLTNIRMSL